MVRRILRIVATSLAVIVVATLVALEFWYRTLLPANMPQPSKRAVPDLLSRTLWAYDFRGDGEPRLRPVVPFIVGSVIGGQEAPHNLAAGVAVFYGKREPAAQYKLHQIALATWISRNWSADEAINTYASHLWMGNEHLGAEAGAMLLFGKPVGQLSVPETALLVATARSPLRLNASCHPQRATDARRAVLERMRAAGLISDDQFLSAVASPLGVTGDCEDRDEARRPTRG